MFRAPVAPAEYVQEPIVEKLKHSQRFQALPDVDKVHMLLHARVSTSRGRMLCCVPCFALLCSDVRIGCLPGNGPPTTSAGGKQNGRGKRQRHPASLPRSQQGAAVGRKLGLPMPVSLAGQHKACNFASQPTKRSAHSPRGGPGGRSRRGPHRRRQHGRLARCAGELQRQVRPSCLQPCWPLRWPTTSLGCPSC